MPDATIVIVFFWISESGKNFVIKFVSAHAGILFWDAQGFRVSMTCGGVEF